MCARARAPLPTSPLGSCRPSSARTRAHTPPRALQGPCHQQARPCVCARNAPSSTLNSNHCQILHGTASAPHCFQIRSSSPNRHFDRTLCLTLYCSVAFVGALSESALHRWHDEIRGRKQLRGQTVNHEQHRRSQTQRRFHADASCRRTASSIAPKVLDQVNHLLFHLCTEFEAVKFICEGRSESRRATRGAIALQQARRDRSALAAAVCRGPCHTHRRVSAC